MRKPVVVRAIVALLAAVLLFVSATQAATREIRVPLKNGKLHVSDLSSAVCHAMDLPAFPLGRGDIDLSGAKGAIFLDAVNLSLGESGRVVRDGSSIVLRVDADGLSSRCDNMSRAVRVL